MKKTARGFKNHILAFILSAIAIIVFAYLNALNTPFILDDVWAIRDNPNVGDPSRILDTPLTALRALFIFLPYSIGGLDVAPYRMLNILFHIGTTVFLYLFVRKLFNERYAWFTALLFAVHPILVESVTWISSLPVPQYSCFLMMSLWLYVKSHKDKELKWYYASLGAYVLSIMSAEKAIVMPALILVLELSFFDIRKNWKRALPFAGVSLIYGLLIFAKIGARSESFARDFYVKREFYNPLIHLPYSISHYFQLILFPKDLTIYHADIYVSWIEMALRAAVFIAYIAAVIVSYFRSKPVFWWLVFFFIVLSPTLIPINIVWMVAERYVYLSTAGFIAAVMYPVYKLSERKKYTQIIYVIIGIIVFLLLARTVVRNYDWQSEDDLWVATAKVSPYSPNARNNMGDYYARHGDYKNAIIEFSAAVKLKPDYGDAYHNLGLAYMQERQLENAVKSFNKAISLNPRLWQSHQNLAAIYRYVKDYPNAVKHARLALENGSTSTAMMEIVREHGGK